MHRPAVFLDRDGVLHNLVLDEVRGVMDGPLTAEQVAIVRGAPAFVAALNQRGFRVIVVTNQPAIAQGRMTPIGLDRIHRKLCADIESGGGRIDGIFFCPHDPDAHHAPGGKVRADLAIECRCRKPAPGLILRAAQVHRIDLTRSFMVCHDLRDVKAGRSAALETILLTNARMREIEAPPDLRPHHVSPDLAGIVRIIDASRTSAQLP